MCCSNINEPIINASNTTIYIPYILEFNPHPFYSFRGLKNQMRIRIACGLDSRSWVGFWKNDKAAVRAVRTIQYNNLFYLLFIIYIYNYYSSESPPSLITESLSVTQSLSSLSSPSSSHKCGLEQRNNFFFRLRNWQKLVRIRLGCGLDSRIYGKYNNTLPNPVLSYMCQFALQPSSGCKRRIGLQIKG